MVCENMKRLAGPYGSYDNAQQLSTEWSHFRNSSTDDSKVRTTLYNLINLAKESTAQQLSLEWSQFRILSQTQKLEPPCTAK